MRPPAVKKRALELGLEVWQPKKVRTAEFAEQLRALDADVAVVVAYGRILPRGVLDAPRTGCVNVHASLLPRWRGAAPIQWSIAHGDEETGVTLMQVDEGMDSGAILATVSTPITPDEDAATLSDRLSKMGAELLREQLARYVAGDLTPQPQEEGAVTMAPLLKKEHGRIDWNKPAQAVHNQIRGMNPWPGAHTVLGERRIKVHRDGRVDARSRRRGSWAGDRARSGRHSRRVRRGYVRDSGASGEWPETSRRAFVCERAWGCSR